MNETLFIHSNLTGTLVYLKDAKGNCLGSFQTVADAMQWCKDNSYNSRLYQF